MIRPHFFFISRLTTLTMPKNSPWVNTPFSTSNPVRASCWITWDMRSSSKETTCLGSRRIVIDANSFINKDYFTVERTQNDWICSSCHAECLECNSPLNTNCIKCDYSNANYKYMAANNTCIVNCPIDSKFHDKNY